MQMLRNVIDQMKVELSQLKQLYNQMRDTKGILENKHLLLHEHFQLAEGENAQLRILNRELLQGKDSLKAHVDELTSPKSALQNVIQHLKSSNATEVKDESRRQLHHVQEC